MLKYIKLRKKSPLFNEIISDPFEILVSSNSQVDLTISINIEKHFLEL
jgi:hypothetical protein